jgi:acyl-CoA thioester hydrolase
MIRRAVPPDPESAIPNPVFSWPARVYWEDTDAGGVVYHARYLHFLERARTEWLRGRGVDQAKLRETHGIVFVVSEMEIRFRSPAKLDDELVATIDSFTRRSASMLFSQCILRAADGARLIEARVRAACVDGATFKPRRIPDFLLPD